jgi:hypothetical protein
MKLGHVNGCTYLKLNTYYGYDRLVIKFGWDSPTTPFQCFLFIASSSKRITSLQAPLHAEVEQKLCCKAGCVTRTSLSGCRFRNAMYICAFQRVTESGPAGLAHGDARSRLHACMAFYFAPKEQKLLHFCFRKHLCKRTRETENGEY